MKKSNSYFFLFSLPSRLSCCVSLLLYIFFTNCSPKYSKRTAAGMKHPGFSNHMGRVLERAEFSDYFEWACSVLYYSCGRTHAHDPATHLALVPMQPEVSEGFFLCVNKSNLPTCWHSSHANDPHLLGEGDDVIHTLASAPAHVTFGAVFLTFASSSALLLIPFSFFFGCHSCCYRNYRLFPNFFSMCRMLPLTYSSLDVELI